MRKTALVGLTVVALLATLSGQTASAPRCRILVDAAPSRVLNTFSPIRALGAGVDRLRGGLTEKFLSPPFLERVMSSGWQPVSYRQNTELFVEAWHWNPEGAWSDPAGQGYFVGNVEPGRFIRHSYAAPLPHRGFTRNSGTDRGYSRLTDGDLETYWKSHPYLTSSYTGEDDALHPQWVTLDLGATRDLDAVRIAWGEPYARRYAIQFWTGEASPVEAPTKGTWQTFPFGLITAGAGGTVTVPLSSAPLPARYLRLWMTSSSNTPDSHGASDRRNAVGYAIRELYAGRFDGRGGFMDLVRHAPDGTQSPTLCSSVDPWHRTSDIDESLGDQVGFDLFYTCGLTRGLPAMIPVAVLYSIPEDAAAQIAYLEKRGYPIACVELGEEPDGQYMLPEDYGALYVQFAAAIHKVDPGLKLGGPSFQGVNSDVEVWPDALGRASWLGRFLDYLRSRGRLDDLAFLSYEHYPYDPCRTGWSDLYREPELISRIMQVWRDDGLPAGLPQFVTEVNLSWQTGETFVDIMGGLWLADYTGAFLASGGQASYFFHYLPYPLHAGCTDASWGSFGLLNVDTDLRVKGYFAQYFASQLISKEWVQPVDREHRVFRAASDARDQDGNTLVTAYALERPDGQWSVLIVNKDRDQARPVELVFQGEDGTGERHLAGSVERLTFGADQYQWHPAGPEGFASPDGPPVKTRIKGAGAGTVFMLPRASITVIRGRLG
jgi:hypothetical protein